MTPKNQVITNTSSGDFYQMIDPLRHSAHIINLKQWLMIHASKFDDDDKTRYTHSHNYHKGDG